MKINCEDKPAPRPKGERGKGGRENSALWEIVYPEPGVHEGPFVTQAPVKHRDVCLRDDREA